MYKEKELSALKFLYQIITDKTVQKRFETAMIFNMETGELSNKRVIDECEDYIVKKIEELKQEKEYLNCIIESDKDNYINKDKIKAKLEEYNKMINATYEDLTHYADYRRDVCFEIKNVLQALLEEIKK